MGTHSKLGLTDRVVETASSLREWYKERRYSIKGMIAAILQLAIIAACLTGHVNVSYIGIAAAISVYCLSEIIVAERWRERHKGLVGSPMDVALIQKLVDRAASTPVSE